MVPHFDIGGIVLDGISNEIELWGHRLPDIPSECVEQLYDIETLQPILRPQIYYVCIFPFALLLHF